MFENGLYNITVKDATSTGLVLGQQKSTSDKSQELLPPILESLSRSVLTRVTLCGEGCKVANRDEDCGHVTSSPPIRARGVQLRGANYWQLLEAVFRLMTSITTSRLRHPSERSTTTLLLTNIIREEYLFR